MKILRRNYSLFELLAFKKSILKVLLSPKKVFNFILVKLSLILRLERCLGWPYNILVEPTGMCNYKCVKCARFATNFKDEGNMYRGKNMPFDHFCHIIDEIGDTLITLRLWRYGEPLLNRDLYRMIRYAKRKNIIVSISTTLSALTEQTAKELVESGLDYLMISFDGASEETYNLYHGTKAYQQVISNIQKIVALKKSLKTPLPFVDLQFVVMKKNEGEMKDMQKLAHSLNIDKLSFFKLDANNINYNKFSQFDSEDSLQPENNRFHFNDQEAQKENFCTIPWEEALICYSGLVLPCAPDINQENRLGKTFTNGTYQGFKRLWNGEEIKKFRSQVKSNIDSIHCCHTCTKRNNSADQNIEVNAL